MHRNFWRHSTSCLNMSIIIHALTPTELAALAPTESSCVHLNKLRLGFSSTGLGGCSSWSYGCSAAWPAEQVKGVANAFLKEPVLLLAAVQPVRQWWLALKYISSDSLFLFQLRKILINHPPPHFFFIPALFLLRPIRKLTFLHPFQSLFYVEIFQNSRSSCSVPYNWKKSKVGQGTKSADINNITCNHSKPVIC